MERNNSGTLSKNDRKTLDRHPDIRGQCVIEGRAYWIAGWRRENERGAFYSLAFTPKDSTETTAGTPPALTTQAPQLQPRSMSDLAGSRTATSTTDPPMPKPLREVLDDDIPF
jgi:hypothetical protein